MYADAVINHMTGGGNDANPNHRNPDAGCATWGIKNSSLTMNSKGTAKVVNSNTSIAVYQIYDFIHLLLLWKEDSSSTKPLPDLWLRPALRPRLSVSFSSWETLPTH